MRIFFSGGVSPLHVSGIDTLRKVAAAPEALARRPEAASSAVLQHRCKPEDMRDVELAARESRMRIRCAAGAEGA